MTPDDFHKIALPLLAASGLALLIMVSCAVALKRQGDQEKARRRGDKRPR